MAGDRLPAEIKLPENLLDIPAQKSNLKSSSGQFEISPGRQVCSKTGGSMVDSPPQFEEMTE
jgi:hypothetical protein